MRTKTLSLLSILCALALVIGFFESFIPVMSVIPGGKIGLSNCVTMVVFLWFSLEKTLAFSVLRSVLTAILFGGVSSLFYSLPGTIFSVFSMFFAKKLLKGKASAIGLSIIGAFFFNAGQILSATFVLRSIHILRYFPVLGILSCFSGLATGYIGKLLTKHLIFKNNGMEK